MSIHRADTIFVDLLADMVSAANKNHIELRNKAQTLSPTMHGMQGFPRVRAEKAVFHTHNCGVEPAVHWLMEHCEDTDIDTPLNLAVE